MIDVYGFIRAAIFLMLVPAILMYGFSRGRRTRWVTVWCLAEAAFFVCASLTAFFNATNEVERMRFMTTAINTPVAFLMLLSLYASLWARRKHV